MTDLEMTELCAKAMGLDDWSIPFPGNSPEPHDAGARRIYEWMMANKKANYDPLQDDAQAMALVKKCEMIIRAELNPNTGEKFWSAMQPGKPYWTKNADLNRAIVECVAKMQQAKDGR